MSHPTSSKTLATQEGPAVHGVAGLITIAWIERSPKGANFEATPVGECLYPRPGRILSLPCLADQQRPGGPNRAGSRAAGRAAGAEPGCRRCTDGVRRRPLRIAPREAQAQSRDRLGLTPG